MILSARKGTAMQSAMMAWLSFVTVSISLIHLYGQEYRRQATDLIKFLETCTSGNRVPAQLPRPSSRHHEKPDGIVTRSRHFTPPEAVLGGNSPDAGITLLPDDAGIRLAYSALGCKATRKRSPKRDQANCPAKARIGSVSKGFANNCRTPPASAAASPGAAR